MLTFLLKIISPSVIPNRKTHWGKWVRFYYWLLLRLLPSYRKSAVSDTIILGNIHIIHSVRDLWFENELQRFRIDTAPHMECQSVPYFKKRNDHRSYLFKWTESLSIFQNGKNYNITRSTTSTIETELEGQLRMSVSKDIILRTEFVTKTQDIPNSTHDTPYSSTTSRKNGAKAKISIKDTIPTTHMHDETQSEPEKVKYQGFEENNIF